MVNSFQPNDPHAVTLGGEHEIQYWCYHFNCTPAQLRDAVDSVGSNPAEVEEYIHILRGDRFSNQGFDSV